MRKNTVLKGSCNSNSVLQGNKHGNRSFHLNKEYCLVLIQIPTRGVDLVWK